MHITTDIKPNFKMISTEIEAFFYTGQPFDDCPDWLRSKYQDDMLSATMRAIFGAG